MAEDNTPKSDAADDDTYVIEDTGATVEEIEREMERAAEEAVQDVSDDDTQRGNAAAGDGDAQAENRELRDRYLRAVADFENFRKRTEREKADFFKYALSGTLKELLPIIDNFDRALEHAAEGDEFHKGVLMIYKQLVDSLKKAGLRVIDEAGVHFDPNIHEGVVREEDPSVPSQTVLAVLQKGYFLHDRLLRPALVKVAVGGPDREPVH